jgi:hypothetical protein
MLTAGFGVEVGAAVDLSFLKAPAQDEGDAMALCFSEPGGAPVISNVNFNRVIEYRSYGVA